jgi:hypothetical protein
MNLREASILSLGKEDYHDICFCLYTLPDSKSSNKYYYYYNFFKKLELGRIFEIFSWQEFLTFT